MFYDVGAFMKKVLNYQKIFFTLPVFAPHTGNALAFEAKLSLENRKVGEDIWEFVF